MDQYNLSCNKKPKKKRLSDIVYYVIYALLIALILATFFFLYKLLEFEMSGKVMWRFRVIHQCFHHIFSHRPNSHPFHRLFSRRNHYFRYDVLHSMEPGFLFSGSMNISPSSGKLPLCSLKVLSTDSIIAWRLTTVSPGRIFHIKSEPIVFLIISSNWSHGQSSIFYSNMKSLPLFLLYSLIISKIKLSECLSHQL